MTTADNAAHRPDAAREGLLARHLLVFYSLLAYAGTLALVLVAAGCTGSNSNTSASSQSSEATQATTSADADGDFAGLVDIGGGRQMAHRFITRSS